MSARLEGMDGVIGGKDFFVRTDAAKGRGKDQTDYAPDASADTAWRSKYFQLVGETHPGYSIGLCGACTSSKAVHLRFMSFADASVQRNFMDFNLDCLTGRDPCQQQAFMMPAISKRVHAEKQDYEARRSANLAFDLSKASFRRVSWP
jgi:hypothetical protein